jgi:hypothetical protein
MTWTLSAPLYRADSIMHILIAIATGLLLSIHGESIGRNLWRIDSHLGMAWRTERDYVLSMRLVGAVIIAIGVAVGWPK